LKALPRIKFFNQDISTTTPWFIDILVEDRLKLMKHLEINSIGTRVMYPPIHSQNAYMKKGEHPVSEMIGKKGLWLPSSSQLKNSQIDYICDTINNFYQ
jgi:perosamine synthetase